MRQDCGKSAAENGVLQHSKKGRCGEFLEVVQKDYRGRGIPDISGHFSFQGEGYREGRGSDPYRLFSWPSMKVGARVFGRSRKGGERTVEGSGRKSFSFLAIYHMEILQTYMWVLIWRGVPLVLAAVVPVLQSMVPVLQEVRAIVRELRGGQGGRGVVGEERIPDNSGHGRTGSVWKVDTGESIPDKRAEE